MGTRKKMREKEDGIKIWRKKTEKGKKTLPTSQRE
jgi:hypothetical protein